VISQTLPVWTLLFIACIVSHSNAVELEPFQVRNLSPAAQVHGLPVAETPRLLAKGRTRISAQFDLASNATFNSRGGEDIIFDGETFIATLGIRYGMTEQLQLGIDLPWIRHSEGFLDSFIDSWHDFFGLSKGDRDALGKDNLNYSYTRNAEELFLVDQSKDGLGDLRLNLAWNFKSTDRSAYTLRTQLKAPTGDADKLTGSDAWDASLSVSAQHDMTLFGDQGAVWWGAGGSWLGDGDVVEDSVEEFAVSGWLGGGWAPLDWLALKLQLGSHTALYDSGLTELGDPALVLTLGGTIGLGEKTVLDVGVGEDLVVDASPDVTLHLAIKHSF
jgi:hypothetical protein